MRLGKDEIKGLQFSPDGTQLAVASWMGIQLYRVSTGEELDLLIGHSSGCLHCVLLTRWRDHCRW